MDALTTSVTNTNVEESELRRGPWTIEEDTLLIHYIARHGDGQWNILAKQAGLKRTGKSCRLRWLNYLKPDVKRGNLTLEEQLLILELHSKWGNRWSKIAQQLPGRTDNEIKNYWRTRVQKQARKLKIDSNSNRFFDSIRHLNDQNQIQNPSDQTLNLQYYSKPSSSSSSSNHGHGNNEEIIQQQYKEQLVLNGDYQMENCSYDPFSPLGFWENAEFDSQMAANDWFFEDSMADNLWNLDKMV